jgi:poly-gamma-glutamate capsule biosynthesis protein CapA/YwtB (metallophosphatase superfamily)
LLVALLLSLGACSGQGSHAVITEEPPQPTAAPVPSPAVPQPPSMPEATPMPEDEYSSIRICIAGDIVAHAPLNEDAYDPDTGAYDYSHIYAAAAPYLSAADFAMADLETTFSGDGSYSGYPLFDSPDDLASSLADAGIDMLITANNHSMDTWFSGLCRTLDVLDANGISHVGTYRTQEERDLNSGILLEDIGGVTVAFLAYTYGTNGLPVYESNKFAVNIYNVDYMTNLSIVDYGLIDADMEYARSLGADFIAVCMHWGNEYETVQNRRQEELADYLFGRGADIIIGGHPHVPQPMEVRKIEKPDGTERTGFICYCLGNFSSNQRDRHTNLTALVNLDIEKNLTTGEAGIVGISYVPMYMLHLESGVERHRLLDINKEIVKYESGEDGAVSEGIYNSLIKGLDDIHSIMGVEQLLAAGRSGAAMAGGLAQN